MCVNNESRNIDATRVFKPIVGPIVGWLYFVPTSITRIMHEEHLQPKVDSVTLRVGEFWKSIGLGGWERED